MSVRLVLPKSVFTRLTLPVKINIPIGIKIKYKTPKVNPNLKVNPLLKRVCMKYFNNKINSIIKSTEIKAIIFLTCL